jgi:hypothetical protein
MERQYRRHPTLQSLSRGQKGWESHSKCKIQNGKCKMRITKEIEIEGKRVWALFDTGALHSYIERALLTKAAKIDVPQPYRVGLGGRMIEVKELFLTSAKIDGLWFDIEAVCADRLGRVDGRDIDVIIGALTMEKWEMVLDPKKNEIDLSGLKRREFTEF